MVPTVTSSHPVRETFNHLPKVSYISLDIDMPPLGDRLGIGRYAEAFRAKHQSESVIRKIKYWKPGFQTRFMEIYQAIKTGHPFEPSNNPSKEDEQLLFAAAMEFRNLKAINELQAPQLDRFCGWFQTRYVHGSQIEHTSGYRHFAFTVPFQSQVKQAFHLVVDRLEMTVREFGIEHR
jgi:hypothetical protein